MSADSLTLPAAIPAPDSRYRDQRLALTQVRYEWRAFWRNRARALWVVLLPLVFLVFFSAANKGAHVGPGKGIPYVQFFVPGILAYAVVMSNFGNIAAGTAIMRDTGILKRLRGTPLPAWVALVGRVGAMACVSMLVAATGIVVAVAAFGLQVRAEAIPALACTLLLGIVAFSALGIGVVRIIPNAEATQPIVSALILPLTFISGVWFPLDGAPGWLMTIAKLFPLEHVAHGMQTALNPTVPGSGFAGNDLLALAIWAVVGARLTLRFLASRP